MCVCVCVTPHDMFETGGKLLMLQVIYCPIGRSVLRDLFLDIVE